MDVIGTAIDGVGVLVIVGGAAWATGRYFRSMRQRHADPYRAYRRSLGRSILLGLEFLVAGDIIRTVVVEPTLDNVAVLGVIVLIRTFLAFSLELEIEGRWPWSRRQAAPP
jgi:uncharacterized membrane protein